MRDQGHEVRLILAQYVKPYVKTNKSDSICTAEVRDRNHQLMAIEGVEKGAGRFRHAFSVK